MAFGILAPGFQKEKYVCGAGEPRPLGSTPKSTRKYMSALNRIGIPIVLVLVFFNHETMSQSFTSDALYVEALGQGVLYSVNYDHRFADHVGFRIGATYFTWSEYGQESRSLTAIPILGEWFLGSRGRYLELAAGVLIAHGRFIPRMAALHRSQNVMIVLTGTIGLRYQAQDNGLIFRLSVVPFVARDDAFIWPGVSFGYAF